jgi:hypothetical protein
MCESCSQSVVLVCLGSIRGKILPKPGFDYLDFGPFSPFTSTFISFMRLTPKEAVFPLEHVTKNMRMYRKPMAIILILDSKISGECWNYKYWVTEERNRSPMFP